MSQAEKDSLAMRKEYAESPVLSPEESMHHFKLEKGLSIHLVASEPVVQTPIALIFDAKARIWALEMTGYMPDTIGTGEDRPQAQIVILEDDNHDGVMDRQKVFMDSLVLPRAICFYDSGLLVAEPPRLWYVPNHNDHAGTRVLVDSNYAVGGNVEHQPNGLYRAIDNWIYNAKSAKRYRRIHGKWEIQRTHFRGQWGISQDNYGRLYYNTNSDNLFGDYFMPGLGAWNPDQKRVSGFNENIVPDNRTYPIRATPGVNRGYQPKVLDDSLRLVNFTAACGPLVFRSKALGAAYEGNAFVAEPSANLIKRNILKDSGFFVIGRQAYQGKEFLASDDERFRPVNLHTGPDGALYVVDMHRGIIQHRTYLTPYLKNEIAMRHLKDPLNTGRIYKITPEGKSLTSIDLSQKSTAELVNLLDDENSWVRETAQRLLTDFKREGAENLLRQKMKEDSFLPGKIHAFWTLEGMYALNAQDINLFLKSDNPILQQEGITAAVSLLNKGNVPYWLEVCKTLLAKENGSLAPYLGFLTSAAAQYAPGAADPLLLKLAIRFKNDPYVSDAVISGLYKREESFLQKFQQSEKDTNLVFYKRLQVVIANHKDKLAQLHRKSTDGKFAHGQQLFETYCQVCHGSDGNGIRSLGAPLNGSPWVTGHKQKLLAIVLYGLTGPIKIGDKEYKEPEVGGEMPAMGQNDQLSDQDLADILSFIRNAWTNQADKINASDVKQVRETYKDRQQSFTMQDLPK